MFRKEYMKNNVIKIISVLLVSVIVFNIVACSTKKEDTEVTATGIVTGNPDSPYASDDLAKITIRDLKVNEINVVSVDPNDIVIKSINAKEIKSVEVQVIPLNDQMVTLAYENFKSVYGENINIPKLITNVVVGAVAVVVCVALTYVSGGTGAFFGAVIASEFSKLAIIIGAALDAAISGYQAYQEGGDAAYILGHMVNGVAEGAMWSAILAPITGVGQGIKAIRAVSKLRKIPALKNITDREASKLLQNLSKLLKQMKNVAGNESDEALKRLFKNLPKELSEEVTEDVFLTIAKNKNTLISIALKENPFGIKGGVIEALRENFWKDLKNVSDDAVKDTIRQIQKNTIKSLDDVGNAEIKEYIRKNASSFIDLYSDKFSAEFVENWLKKEIGNKAFKAISENIISPDGVVKISRKIGHDALAEILKNPSQTKLIAKRFGSESVEKLRSIHKLYNITVGGSSAEAKVIYKNIENLINGTLELSAIENSTIAENLIRHSESVSQIVKSLGIEGKNTKFLSELAYNSLARINGISDDVARDIVSSRMSKSNIISKYGDDVWRRITENAHTSIVSITIAPEANSSLLKEITQDSLSRMGCSNEAIERILRGETHLNWGISDRKFIEIENAVSEYYRATNSKLYKSFTDDCAEIRGRYIASKVEQYQKANTMINLKYAGGVMAPTGDNADYILEKYGQIQMSKQGFAIFDEHSIARVVIEDLTGDETDDIARANLIHHGTKSSIPGYTWHHLEDGKTLILIPTELHEAYRHTGGAALIREGLLP